MLYRPRPDCGIGNLTIYLATHRIYTNGQGTYHPDVYAYGRDRMFQFKYVGDPNTEIKDSSCTLNSYTHLRCPNLGEVMRDIITPSAEMQARIDEQWPKLADCVAGFHIRRGTYAEDSSKFAYFPSASQLAVDAMIGKALTMDAPVFVISDSVSTKKYFLERVPKAVALDLTIGFTACEHSQNHDTEDESVDAKFNSALEWFLMSKMPQVYTTMGGVCGRNVYEGIEEGVSSTFGFSAAIYGGKIPYYVYNDGTFFYANTPQRGWSDIDTGKYLIMRNPTKEKIERARLTHGMWKVLVDPKECEEAGISAWCDTRVHVQKIDPAKPVRALKVKEFEM